MTVSDDSYQRWVTCPNCNGKGQPQGDGSGWDGASMHTPACDICDGRGEVPECDNWHDSCHGDPDIDECACIRAVRDRVRRAQGHSWRGSSSMGAGDAS